LITAEVTKQLITITKSSGKLLLKLKLKPNHSSKLKPKLNQNLTNLNTKTTWGRKRGIVYNLPHSLLIRKT
jgi:hypothetical protein